MKKVTLLLIFSLIFDFGKAQINFPFPTDSVEWTYYDSWVMGIPDVQHNFKYNGDTIINNISYSKLYLNSTDGTSNKYVAAIRNDSTNISFIIKADSLHEKLFYNFNLKIGDTLSSYTNATSNTYYEIVDLIDNTIDSNGENRRTYHFNDGFTWIEGIGNTHSLLNPNHRTFQIPVRNDLKCFHQNDTLVYLNPIFDDCFYDNTGIDESTKTNVNINPNPITKTSVLKIENTTYQNLKINFYNINGALVKSDKITNNQFLINAFEFTAGIHFYRIENVMNEIVTTGKVIIK